MNKSIEIIAMILGSISLLTVCFLGFAVMSGTPLHEIAGIGRFFSPPATEESDSSGQPVPDPTRAPERPDDETVFRREAGLLPNWNLPSPYDAQELKSLVDGLKLHSQELDLREVDLDRRESELDAQEETITNRLEGLMALQTQLEERQSDLALDQAELESARQEETQRVKQEWTDIAKIVEAMEEDKRNAFLVGFEPGEIAQILRSLTIEDRAKALSGLQDKITDPDRFAEILDAYKKLGGNPAGSQ